MTAAPGAPDALACALFLLGAFVMAGLMHCAWLRSAVSRPFAIPLDGGRSLRGRRIFGDNKTVRGFMVIIPGAALSFAVLASLLSPGLTTPVALWQLSVPEYAALGAWAALGFMVGELPNSFVKRQLGVSPGAAPRSPLYAVLAFAVDRLDSACGMLLAISVVVPTSRATWGWVLLLGPAIHGLFSLLLFRLGVKRRMA